MGSTTYGKGFDDETASLKARLAETTLLLEVLAYVNANISKCRTFEEFCFSVCDILKNKLKFDHIYIWIRDEKNPDVLRLVTPDPQEEDRTTPVHIGIIGKTIREGRTICAPDVTRDPDYRMVRPKTKSELCVPLIYDNKIIGALNIETDSYHTFENQKTIIEIISANLSQSLKLALLYKTEEYFHHVVEHMSEGVWVNDAEERAIYTNPAMQRISGYKAEELFGTVSYEYFDEKSKQRIYEENKKRKTGLSGRYEITLISKTGEHIPVLINAVPFGKGGNMATITDLRQLKIAEQRLYETKSFLASITQYCPEAIVGITEDDIVQSWNIGAEQIFGFKAEEMTGKSIQAIIPQDRIDDGESLELIKEAKRKGLVRNFETVRLHKNGKPINVSITLNSIKDHNKNLMGFSVFYRDITAQKKWERELQDRFEKMQDAYKEMGRQRRQLDYLIELMNLTLTPGATKKQIATFIVNAIVMFAKIDAVTVRLFQKNTNKLILMGQSGVGEDWWSRKIAPYKGSLLEKAVEQDGPMKILDILSSPFYPMPSLARKNNLRSAFIIPLQVKDELIGSLILYLSPEGNLSVFDDEFIMIFAKQAAIALKMAS
ncbi:PAS domain S-box protein [Candidatus Peregrinibacteria bacterium]|nr:PAS domain S-box protein [Candidatus Peregrinibacteria bacterium]